MYWLRRHPLALSMAAAVSMAGWAWATPLRDWDLTMTGVAQEWRGARAPRSPVLIVAIDEFTLQQSSNADLSHDPLLKRLQSWPWPRAVHAVVLDRLYAAGARAVALDLLFDSPSAHGSADDLALAKSLRQHRPHTVLAAQALESSGSVAGLTISPPLGVLQKAAGEQSAGLLNAKAEPNGAIRRRPGDHALDLQRLLGQVPSGLSVSLLRAARLPDRSQAPTDWTGWKGLLEGYGPPQTIPTLSLWSLLEPQAYTSLLASGRLRDQVVLVGPTAAVFQDLHRAPFAGPGGMPGIELHATELANRLEGRGLWLWHPGQSWALVLGVVSLLAGLLAERWERPLQRLTVLAGIAGSIAAAAVGLAGWWALGLPLFSTAAAVLMVGIVSSAEATTRLQWQRQRLRSALGRYLSPAVAAEIASQPREADGLLGGRSTDVVVMIADIRGFTARTRRMSQAGQARDLVHQLNDYFAEVVAAVHHEGGTIDKFIGDAALAVFGAPLNRGASEEAAAALRAAQDLQVRLQRLNSHWQGEGKEPWDQVIVLNFGTVISGNVGCNSRMDYTVIGDAVNATSRLESAAKESNRSLVMAAAFAELLDSQHRLEPLGSVNLRGYGKTELFGLGPSPS